MQRTTGETSGYVELNQVEGQTHSVPSAPPADDYWMDVFPEEDSDDEHDSSAKNSEVKRGDLQRDHCVDAEKALAIIGLHNHKAKTAMVLDISYSMDGPYENGSVQRALSIAAGIAVEFSDQSRHSLSVYLFAKDVFPVVNITEHHIPVAADKIYERVHREWRITKIEDPRCQGTVYWKPLEQAFKEHLSQEWRTKKFSNETPLFMLFITDGGNKEDRTQFLDLMEASSKCPVYVLFVGVGPETEFKLLNDVCKGSSNASVTVVNDLKNFNLDKPDKIFGHYVEWLKVSYQSGLIRNPHIAASVPIPHNDAPPPPYYSEQNQNLIFQPRPPVLEEKLLPTPEPEYKCCVIL